jgi:hypothetical protein
MRRTFLCCLIFLLVSLSSGLDITQSLVGEGQWSTDVMMGGITTEMSGQGDMSYAAQGSSTGNSGAILKSGLEFDGLKGRIRIKSNLGNDIFFNSFARDANHISLRTKIDTVSSEDTQDSTIGSLSLHSVSLNGQINGSFKEDISNGFYMGRSIDVSKIVSVGNFTINSTLNLKEYYSGSVMNE